MKKLLFLFFLALISMSYTVPSQNGEPFPVFVRGGIESDTARHQLEKNSLLETIETAQNPRSLAAVKKPGLLSVLLSGGGLLTTILTLALPGPFLLFILGVLAGTAGLILGISTLSRIKKKMVSPGDKGSAITGVVLGALTFLTGFVVLFAYLVIASVFGA